MAKLPCIVCGKEVNAFPGLGGDSLYYPAKGKQYACHAFAYHNSECAATGWTTEQTYRYIDNMSESRRRKSEVN